LIPARVVFTSVVVASVSSEAPVFFHCSTTPLKSTPSIRFRASASNPVNSRESPAKSTRFTLARISPTLA